MKTYYMPMVMKLWGTAYLFPRGLADEKSVADLADVPGSAGFIPLYETIDALQAAHGLVPFQRVQWAVEASEDAPTR